MINCLTRLLACTELNESEGNLQVETESVKPGDASFIKFRILSGWTEFVALHRVCVEGTARRLY